MFCKQHHNMIYQIQPKVFSLRVVVKFELEEVIIGKTVSHADPVPALYHTFLHLVGLFLPNFCGSNLNTDVPPIRVMMVNECAASNLVRIRLHT